jgi:hypothetical protein
MAATFSQTVPDARAGLVSTTWSELLPIPVPGIAVEVVTQTVHAARAMNRAWCCRA